MGVRRASLRGLHPKGTWAQGPAACGARRSYSANGRGALAAVTQAAIRRQERRAIRKWLPVVVAAVELVCAPAWSDTSAEALALEDALRNIGLITYDKEL